MKLADGMDRLARSGRPLRRIRERLDAAEAKKVVGATPMMVREPVGQVTHQHTALRTR